MKLAKISAVAAACAVAGSAVAQSSIVKPPDIGPWWQPLDPNSGSYVYASDFVFNEADTTVESLGTWLNLLRGTTVSGRFEIWGDNNGPDANNVISTTGSVTPNVQLGTLDYFEFPASGGTLNPGERYWFAITVVGEQGDGAWQTGGHTQNSVYNDNGTFWYSNDANGVNFDGQGLTPQIAFQVNMVPTPGSLALLGLGGLAMVRRRR